MSEPVVVIGGGPAGLSCTAALVAGGREVVLIDDNASAGGQYFRQLPPSYHATPEARLMRDKRRFDELAEVLSHPKVRHLPSTVAWGAPGPRTIAYAGPAGSGRVRASAVVIAGGAQEKALPFTGWTLPGVISAGGCLNLAKAHGLVPSGRMVIAGNGPLVLVAAATMLAAGGEIAAVVEARSDLKLGPAALGGLLSAPGVLATGIGYRARILRSGTPFRAGWMVAEARGKDTLQEVALAPIGADGRPVRERQRWIAAEILVVGYGLLPGSEAARMLGCRMRLDPALNGVVPERDGKLETSVPGVHAIGDGAGIGGVEVALLEGRIAAAAILDVPPSPGLLRRYRRLDHYRRTLNLAYAMPKPLVSARDDTIICRCEEISFAALSADPNSTRSSLNALKTSSRLGMGRCQGRNCLHVASSLLNLNAEAQPTYPRARPPVQPIRVGQLAADADVGPSREPDEINLSQHEKAS